MLAWYMPGFSRIRDGSGFDGSANESASTFCVAWYTNGDSTCAAPFQDLFSSHARIKAVPMPNPLSSIIVILGLELE